MAEGEEREKHFKVRDGRTKRGSGSSLHRTLHRSNMNENNFNQEPGATNFKGKTSLLTQSPR